MWYLSDDCYEYCAGLSSFVNNPSEASEHLVVLLQYAAALVPKDKHGQTPVYIMATAGLRLLDARWAIKHCIIITPLLYGKVVVLSSLWSVYC